MSQTLNGLGTQAAQALGLPPLFTNWKTRLRPASFRGVPFFVLAHEETGGRHGVIHEFPLRENISTEDLGPAARRFTVDAYLVGDDYDQTRDALRRAVYQVSGAGTLVHPWLGTMQVQPMENCSLRETRDLGGMAVFRLVFAATGTQDLAPKDTVSGLLNGLGPVIQALKLGFAVGALIATHPGFLLQALAGGLTSFANGLLGLPVGTLSGVSSLATGLVALATDTTDTAAGCASAMQAAADAIVANPPDGTDPSGGLAGLATWSGAIFPLATATPGRAQQAANAQALQDLVNGLAVAAMAQVYAQVDFVSANAAQAARTQLLALIDARMVAASAANDDGSFAAWRALAASASAYLLQAAQALPQIASYSIGRSQPALVLAYRLYGAIDQAEAMADLNGVAHPLFLPAQGIWLEPQA